MNDPIVTFFCFAHQIGSWNIRIHSPHGNVPNAQRHVHITKRGLGGEYSWNIDGTRHDNHRFPQNDQCIKAAKKHAAKSLGIPIYELHFIVQLPGKHRVSVRHAGASQEMRCYIKQKNCLIFIGSTIGLICIQLPMN